MLTRRDFLSGAAAMGSWQAHHAEPRRQQYERWVFPPPDTESIGGVRHEIWTARPAKDSPSVIVLHEITGASDEFFAYADTLVDAGFSVHCPVLFGSPFVRRGRVRGALYMVRACNLFSEFECWSLSANLTLNKWLVALATEISGKTRNPVAAIGMCLTGIQPLAMLRCGAVVAPVVCQPTLPLGGSIEAKRDLGLPPADADFAIARVKYERLDVLHIRYAGDTISSRPRAERLNRALAPHVQFVEVPGNAHSSLVHDPTPQARTAVVEFLKRRLV